MPRSPSPPDWRGARDLPAPCFLPSFKPALHPGEKLNPAIKVEAASTSPSGEEAFHRLKVVQRLHGQPEVQPHVFMEEEVPEAGQPSWIRHELVREPLQPREIPHHGRVVFESLLQAANPRAPVMVLRNSVL